MTPQRKTITLLITTLIVYAVIGWIQTRQLIFPFPLNEVIFLLIVGYFYFLTKDRWSLLLVVGACFFVGSNEFYWNLFLTSEQMVRFSKLLITDICLIFFYIIFIFNSIQTFRTSLATKRELFFNYTLLVGLVLGLFLNSNLAIASALLGLSIVTRIVISKNSDTLNFQYSLYLLTFLEISKTSTLLLA